MQMCRHKSLIKNLFITTLLAFFIIANSSYGFTFDANDFGALIDLKPSVYYVPNSIEEPEPCDASEKVALKNSHRETLTYACPQFIKKLNMQGTAFVEHDGHVKLIQFVRKTDKGINYAVTDTDRCPWGLGQNGMCLQPYISVAADKRYYQAGQVIYIPAVAKQRIRLPNGQIHPGFFVVSDSGSLVRGPHRFDFFVGDADPFNNPLADLGLTGACTSAETCSHFKFQVVVGDTAEKFIANYYK